MFIADSKHYSVISQEIKNADTIWLAMAYVSVDGVNEFYKAMKGKRVNLVCNIDLGSTTLLAIKKLLALKAEVKIYRPASGIFHPKLWLFGKTRKPKKFVIGSANFTKRGVQQNTEAGVLVSTPDIVNDAYNFFQRLWDSALAETVTLDTIDPLIDSAKERERQQRKIVKRAIPKTKTEMVDELLQFTNQWVEFPRDAKLDGVEVWRGWYIIPDQGLVSDELIEELRVYLPNIKGVVDIGKTPPLDPHWEAILSDYHDTLSGRRKDKMEERDLFIRSRKNYLTKFGWVEHPQKPNGKKDKSKIFLTPLGAEVRDAKTLAGVKDLYTDYFLNYEFWGFKILQFMEKLLFRVDSVNFEEMNYFVKHAVADSDMEIIVRMIEIHRGLSDDEREGFAVRFKESFDRHKEPTGKGVYTNYIKSIKHTMSAIGWCNPFVWDGEKLELKQ